MQNKRYLEIIKGLKEAIADAGGKCERSVHRTMEVKMSRARKEQVIATREYIQKHADEYILCRCFPQKVADKFGVSKATVRKILYALKLKPIHQSADAVRALFADGKKHSVAEAKAVGGYGSANGAWSMIKKLGYQEMIAQEDKRGKYKKLDITKYRGFSQAELARELGVRYDAICRATKTYGWAPYLKPPAKKKVYGETKNNLTSAQ